MLQGIRGHSLRPIRAPEATQSGAMTRKPFAARNRIWWRQRYVESGHPWSKSTGRPPPWSSMWSEMPLTCNTPLSPLPLCQHKEQLVTGIPGTTYGTGKHWIQPLHMSVAPPDPWDAPARLLHGPFLEFSKRARRTLSTENVHVLRPPCICPLRVLQYV